MVNDIEKLEDGIEEKEGVKITKANLGLFLVEEKKTFKTTKYNYDVRRYVENGNTTEKNSFYIVNKDKQILFSFSADKEISPDGQVVRENGVMSYELQKGIEEIYGGLKEYPHICEILANEVAKDPKKLDYLPSEFVVSNKNFAEMAFNALFDQEYNRLDHSRLGNLIISDHDLQRAECNVKSLLESFERHELALDYQQLKVSERERDEYQPYSHSKYEMRDFRETVMDRVKE